MPPLRVTFLTHYAELYGANLSLLNLIDGLASHGIESSVIGPEDGDLMAALAARNVSAAVLPFEWWASTDRTTAGIAERSRRNVRHLRPIVRRMAAWSTELVYSNSSVFSIGALAAVELGLPHVWHLREFGRRDYDLLPDLGHRMNRLAFASADATICVSNALKRAMLGKIDRSSIHVVSNGVASIASFDERMTRVEAARARTQPFTFVLVGRFRESKGQDTAIRAFALVSRKVADVRLILVGGAGGTGDQSFFEFCVALASELGVAERIEFWGYIPDPERAFLAADVALMCSRNEAMGRVTAEAMSCSRPVIGFDSGGTSELIEHERTGLLYRGGPDELADCMLHYARNPADAIRHGSAGWDVARARNSTETYAERIAAILQDVRS